jgi:hypothetical protein
MKKISYLVFVAIIAVTIFSSPLFAQEKAADAKGGTLFEYKCKMGDIQTFAVKMNGRAEIITAGKSQAESFDVNIEVEQKCLHIGKEGNLDFQTLVKTAKVKDSKGVVTDLAEAVGKTVYMTITKHGKMLGITSYDPNMNPMGISPDFPDKPINPGYSWTMEIKPSDQVPVPLNARYTFTGMEKYKGKECAIVKVEQSVPNTPDMKNIRASGDGKLYFDVVGGRLVMMEVGSKLEIDQELENQDPSLGPPVKKITTKLDMKTIIESI